MRYRCLFDHEHEHFPASIVSGDDRTGPAQSDAVPFFWRGQLWSADAFYVRHSCGQEMSRIRIDGFARLQGGLEFRRPSAGRFLPVANLFGTTPASNRIPYARYELSQVVSQVILKMTKLCLPRFSEYH